MRDASYSYTSSPTMTVFAPCGTMHNDDTLSACTHSLLTREKRLACKPGMPQVETAVMRSVGSNEAGQPGGVWLIWIRPVTACRRDTTLPLLFTPSRISLLRIVVVLIAMDQPEVKRQSCVTNSTNPSGSKRPHSDARLSVKSSKAPARKRVSAEAAASSFRLRRGGPRRSPAQPVHSPLPNLRRKYRLSDC